jgi:hypothetical protein
MRKGAIAGGLVAAVLLGGLAAPAGATFPGRNASIVYVDRGHVLTIAPDADIYVMNPDGSGLAKLTDDGTASEPDWGALEAG